MQLVISNVAVKQDKSGRYCLNDLQRAAVNEEGESRSARTMEVHEFMRRPETRALIDLLENETTGNLRSLPVLTIQGRNGGTFVCKELVYAYAMWISPRFNLHVIRTFDAAVAKEQIRVSYRDSAKLEYRPMTDAIKHEREVAGKAIAPHHFSNEADLINRIALGMTAAKFRVHHEIGKTENLRDYLTTEQIHCVTELQRANTVFITMGWTFDQRKEALKGLFDRNHRLPLIEEQHRLAA
ncbi:KilA-N domain-containing protein [Klebsiella quasipneumoniae subsp. similipneumoniae]|uniref:KilA-N domain-containing protein n=1 Tax=Klebsiella quasipneumoniae TaxID=1463165 RepID=UPI0035A8DFB8